MQYKELEDQARSSRPKTVNFEVVILDMALKEYSVISSLITKILQNFWLIWVEIDSSMSYKKYDCKKSSKYSFLVSFFFMLNCHDG